MTKSSCFIFLPLLVNEKAHFSLRSRCITIGVGVYRSYSMFICSYDILFQVSSSVALKKPPQSDNKKYSDEEDSSIASWYDLSLLI